jgi:N6-adenosine-specific RNA methylase IME4
VAADCPWQPDDALPGPGRGAAKHYPTISTADLCALAYRLPPIAPDALLFLWRLASMQQDAMLVARAWGFRVVSEIVWVKTAASGKPRIGMGRYVRAAHETALICARGRGASLIRDHAVPSVFHAPRGRHSAKPAAFYGMVERLAAGPYLEVFGRELRDGWTVLGDEVGSRLRLPLEARA